MVLVGWMQYMAVSFVVVAMLVVEVWRMADCSFQKSCCQILSHIRSIFCMYAGWVKY
jgi:hypothetical protein